MTRHCGTGGVLPGHDPLQMPPDCTKRRSAGLTRNTADVAASATTPSTKASAERLVNIAEAVDEARRVEAVSVFQDLLAIE
jgi:hypothetical protein